MICEGIYHFFYQHNPKGPIWKKILVWGHSTSMDLINWISHDPAIIPYSHQISNESWSGSAIICLEANQSSCTLELTEITDKCRTWLCPKIYLTFSLENGLSHQKNPLILRTERNGPSLFRDPTTAWLGPDKMENDHGEPNYGPRVGSSV